MPDETDAKQILTAPPAGNWTRPLGRSRITWMQTIQQDLKSSDLNMDDAVNLAQNHPLWRLMSTFGATHSQRCLPEMMMTMMYNQYHCRWVVISRPALSWWRCHRCLCLYHTATWCLCIDFNVVGESSKSGKHPASAAADVSDGSRQQRIDMTEPSVGHIAAVVVAILLIIAIVLVIVSTLRAELISGFTKTGFSSIVGLQKNCWNRRNLKWNCSFTFTKLIVLQAVDMLLSFLKAVKCLSAIPCDWVGFTLSQKIGCQVVWI